MTATQADLLLARLEQSQAWPPRWERTWQTTRIWQALREADGEFLRRIAGWDTAEHRSRNYIVDPLPSKISSTFAELIFGEDPTITPHARQDAARLDQIVEENELPSELQAAADLCVSEGEVWWRIFIDRDQADVPLIDFHSRLDVLPVLRGRTVVAAAFYSTYCDDPPDNIKTVWRYFEIHADGVIINALFRGGVEKLGARVPLDSRPETEDLLDRWDHGLPMLAGRILNKRSRASRPGLSEYAAVRALLFALNETATIGQENARMTLKQRVVIPDRYLDIRGNFPAGADVIVAPTTDIDPDKPGEKLAQIEWTFDAAAFIAYKEDLERTVLGRVGLARQLIDAGNPTPDGRATGTALRLRLIPSMLAAAGKGRFWDDALPRVLMLMQLVDQLEETDGVGGFGYTWTAAAEAPVVERTDPLPEDETEESARHATLVAAEIESRRTAIEELHPDWDDQRISDELAQILREQHDFTTSNLPPVPSPDTTGDPSGQLA